MTDVEFTTLLDNNIPLNHNIFKYLMVTRNKLREHQRIAVSYSSGSDSDIMLDMIELQTALVLVLMRINGFTKSGEVFAIRIVTKYGALDGQGARDVPVTQKPCKN